MSSRRVVFLGPPGAGKGTQAALASSKLSIPHISTGDMLRAAVKAGSDLGNKVKDIMDSGQLVSDELIVELIEQRISEEDCKEGYILDGFPRTLAQGESLKKMLSGRDEPLTHVLLFDVSHEELMGRLSNRREAESRSDDSAAIQEERLRVYREQTEPLIEFYRDSNLLGLIDAHGEVEDVFGLVTKHLAEG